MMTLAQYMRDRGLTDTELARALGKPPQTVNRWRRGLRRPRNVRELQAIREVTGGLVTAESFYLPDEPSTNGKAA
jgi:transcriptional regulator with XRE-family HTH domain